MGAQTSIMETKMEKEITQTSKKNLESSIEASSQVACQNLQEIKDSTIDCHVKFGVQSCDGQAIMDFVGQNTMEDTTKQDIIDITSQMNQQEMSGVALLQAQTNIQRTNEKVAYKQMQETNMTLSTDCSINLDLFNVQRIQNTECKDKGSITFAAQKITALAMASCASKQGGKTESSQGLTKMMEQGSTQKLDGVSLMDILFPMIMGLVMVFFGPMLLARAAKRAIDVGRYATKQEQPPPGPMTKMAKWVFGIFFILLFVWWPCPVGAWYLGVWPYGEPAKDFKDSPCINGKLKKDVVDTNKFVQWDGGCAYQEGTVCSESDKLFSYKCGIFSGSCTDPSEEMKKEMDAYKAYVKQCGKTPRSVGECTGVSLYSKSTPKTDKIDGCKVCTTGPYKGGFVKEDADCGTAKAQYRKFMVDEEQKGATPCKDEEGEFCTSDVEAYKTEFPDDCDDVGYQNIKRRVSGLLRGTCDTLNAVVPEGLKNTDTNTFSVSNQCSATAPDFMQCGDNGKCWYIPAGCVYKEGTRPKKLTSESELKDFDCSSVNKKVLAACRNDFTECTDPHYLEDSGYDKGAEELCKKAHEKWEGLHMTLLWVTIGIYLFLLFLAIGMTVVGGNRDRRAFEANKSGGVASTMAAFKPQKSGKVAPM